MSLITSSCSRRNKEFAVDEIENLWGGDDFSKVNDLIQTLISSKIKMIVGEKEKDEKYEIPALRKHLDLMTSSTSLWKMVSSYIDSNLAPFFCIVHHEKEKRRNILTELSVEFSCAFLPGFLSVDKVGHFARFFAWLYETDDVCFTMVKRLGNYQWATNEWYGNYMQRIVVYSQQCLDAVCNMKSCPETPSQDHFLMDTEKAMVSKEVISQVYTIAVIFGPALCAVMEPIVRLVGRAAGNRIQNEVNNYLNGKKEEALTASTTLEEWYQRRSKTGAVRPSIELALSLCWIETDVSPDMSLMLDRLGSSSSYLSSWDGSHNHLASPFFASFHNCDITVITGNDTLFVKNIGEHEEEQMAILIYQKLSSQGIDVKNLDLSTATGHGEILASYGSSDYAFDSLKIILEDLQKQMVFLSKSCEDLVNAADDTNNTEYKFSARIATRVFLKFCFGNFLFSSYSMRYLKSFDAVMAVLQGSKMNFKAVVENFC